MRKTCSCHIVLLPLQPRLHLDCEEVVHASCTSVLKNHHILGPACIIHLHTIQTWCVSCFLLLTISIPALPVYILNVVTWECCVFTINGMYSKAAGIGSVSIVSLKNFECIRNKWRKHHVHVSLLGNFLPHGWEALTVLCLRNDFNGE